MLEARSAGGSRAGASVVEPWVGVVPKDPPYVLPVTNTWAVGRAELSPVLAVDGPIWAIARL